MSHLIILKSNNLSYVLIIYRHFNYYVILFSIYQMRQQSQVKSIFEIRNTVKLRLSKTFDKIIDFKQTIQIITKKVLQK